MDRRHAVAFSILGLIGSILTYIFIRERRKHKGFSPRTSRTVADTIQEYDNSSAVKMDRGDILNTEHAAFLNNMLDSQDYQKKALALITIANMSAFRDNQIVFRECGSLHKVVSIVTTQELLLQLNGSTSSTEVLNNALSCLNNLALDEQNQLIIEKSIAAIARLLQNRNVPRSTKLACLNVLINLSVLPTIHRSFNILLPVITSQVFKTQGNNPDEETLRLSALKVLVNLSNEDELAVELLSCEVPRSVSLTPTTCSLFQQHDILLRWLTFLSHLLDLFAKVKRDRLQNSVENRVFLGSLFLEGDLLLAMKHDLEEFLDRTNSAADKKEQHAIASSIRDKLNSLH